jgi:hypothetical protein
MEHGSAAEGRGRRGIFLCTIKKDGLFLQVIKKFRITYIP